MCIIQKLVSTVIAAALAVGLSACTPGDQLVPSAPTPAAEFTGVREAAHLDDGYLQIGSGGKVVDLYIDPMCPFCKLFEELSGPMLFSEASAGNATLRVHPVAILNRLSQGANYSTRAAAALTAVAANSPDNLVEFLRSLYANQPGENTAGLTNDALSSLAEESGAKPVSAEEVEGYAPWVDAQTTKVRTGPLPTTADIRSIERVPTLVVNGAVFVGNSNESAAFLEFYRAH